MRFSKQPTLRSAASFGRREAVKPRQASARPAPHRRPTISNRPEARTREALAQAAEVVTTDVTTAASRGKAYFNACLAGTAAFVAALFFLSGVENRVFQAGPVLLFLAIPILPTLALILYIPTVALSDLARLLRVPRGWADIGIGLVLGAGLGIAFGMSSEPDGNKSAMMALAMTTGGFVGGFAFWRAQGYPGTTSAGTAAAFDAVYEKMT
ncbi:hypothetical protein [Hyphomicrobium sp. LHD-15]|uniref:hypothetical protein n=1 Tax=Hyphomicrobium sp. LHD-15 TaxID=3072142 RepID=UPI00280EA389|nr:hypothetical protein [Hyphomicrobium sp. LHD-15]MDQ8699528.1 hypothetical protein [Hyphomicrobium sp. LHD-15]